MVTLRCRKSIEDYYIPSVKTHCCFSSSGALCLTRTRVLKADPQEDVGEDCQEVTNEDDDKDLVDINDEQGRAVRGRAMWTRTEISVYK